MGYDRFNNWFRIFFKCLLELKFLREFLNDIIYILCEWNGLVFVIKEYFVLMKKLENVFWSFRMGDIRWFNLMLCFFKLFLIIWEIKFWD